MLLLIVIAISIGCSNTTQGSELNGGDTDVSGKGMSFNFLLLGEDDAANLCDVIIIVSYDTASHKIEALQIPRDTYASYTSASYRKINGALHSLGSMDALADFIEKTLKRAKTGVAGMRLTEKGGRSDA